MDDWDLYRHFLAVARAGSLSAAASELGDSQPTIGRRIDSLERKLGIRLFTRTRRGFTPTPSGEALLEVVGRMEREAENADRLALGSDGGLTGRVRISASEGLGVMWLIPHLAKLEEETPGLRIEVRIDNSPLDLSRGHADIALRLNPSSRSDVFGRRVGSLAFGLYASRDYLAARGTPRAANELRRHRIITPSGVVARHPLYAWFHALAAGAEEGFTCDSILGQVAAARAGLGIAMISCVVAAGAPELERVLPRLGRAPDLWIVTHRDLRRAPRIRAVLDVLTRAAREDRLRLSGGEGGRWRH
jgi:DNA-binding transcriptional LysR family regulator